jgi:endonuclease/exonuclease/phosphatase (EEP) superfamily protein YafD
MLLSRHPFVERPELLVGDPEWRIDQPIGVIAFDGAPCALMSVHLPAPNSVGQLVAGPRMTARLADWVETQATDGRAAVLAGDFNAPLWTERMSSLRTAGVRSAHAESGGGRGATWPSKSPLRYAPGIRLDHAGFVGGLACVESRVLGATGSDHRPILARFVRTP